MKRFTLILVTLLVVSSALLADDAKTKQEQAVNPAVSRELRSRVFEIHNRDPRTIARSITLLGSGRPGAGVDVNDDLDTITVRDFPENLATIEEAIKRLDVATPPEPEIEFHIYVLAGSNTGEGSSGVPEELTDVVKQLRSTLRYSNYELMTSAIHRTRAGSGIEGSGVAQNSLAGYKTPEGQPVIYDYTLGRITVQKVDDQNSIDVQRFEFSMRVPIPIGGDKTSYQAVGFKTPLTVREGEKVVVGTTTMGDRALIVVVTTKVE